MDPEIFQDKFSVKNVFACVAAAAAAGANHGHMPMVCMGLHFVVERRLSRNAGRPPSAAANSKLFDPTGPKARRIRPFWAQNIQTSQN